MVDAPASGAGVSNDMEVRVFSRVPIKNDGFMPSFFIYVYDKRV